MRAYLEAWADAIGYGVDPDGAPAVDGLCRTLRSAVFHSGFVTLARLTSGLREAYSPLGVSDTALTSPAAEAIRLLVLTGDVEEFSTAAGRAYASTPPRSVVWGGEQVALLGALDLKLESNGVRRVARSAIGSVAAAEVTLAEELGRAEWSLRLVELGGADAGDGDASALAQFAAACAASGDRYVDDPYSPAVVLSGRGDYFGDPRNAPGGRWRRIGDLGTFPAVVKDAYRSRRVVMHLDETGTRVWTPADHDLWRWIVVASTLAQGDEVLRYAPDTGLMNFLTPPPRQLERAARLAGTQVSPWIWRLDAAAFDIVSSLIHPPTERVARGP